MTTFVDANGSLLGETLDYVPANGVAVTQTTTAAQSSLVSGDATGSGFNITLDFSGGGLTASQQSIFAGAASRWEKIITGDLPDVGSIDDVKIAASGKAIDGVGTILGQAGYTALRSGSLLPYTGSMSFDSADLASMESNGSLLDVITHEMGHVLGIGSLWSRKGLILGAGTTASRFVGSNALNEYRHFIGDNSASSIPVETDGGAGTADAHWDDSTFGTELMTGYLSYTNQLSRMSAASLIDMGYSLVNVDATDLYTMSNALPVVGSLSATSAALGANVQLSLSTASDADGIGSISFYRETNGIAGLQSTGTVTPDTLIVTNSGSNLTAQAATTGLSVGTYTFYARATDAKGALSAVATTTANVINVVVPATPGTPDLADGSDTGDSSTDNLTANRQPAFTGTATAAAVVTLIVDGQVVGTTTADATGAYSISPSAALGDGTHSIAVTATTIAGTSAVSSALKVTIDSVGGTAGGFVYDRERTQQISFKLDDATLAARLTAAGVSLLNDTTGATFGVQIVSVDAASGIVTLAAATQLTDGEYVLTLPATSARDAAGNALTMDATFTFTQLYGDANGDNQVNFDDLLLLGKSYGTASGQSASTGNVDYSSDGAVNFNDLLVLAKNYGTTLIGSTPTTASSIGRASNAATSLSSILSSVTAVSTSSTSSTTRTRKAGLRSPFLG